MTSNDADGGDDLVFWRFSQFVELSPGERRELASLMRFVRTFDPGRSLHAAGDEPGLFFLGDGWVLSSIETADGGRQVLKVHRPGDVMGAPSLPFAEAVETLTALTRCRASVIERRAVGALFEAWPRLGAVLFAACQVERVALMDRLVAAGKLDAAGRFVALLLQLSRTNPPGAEGDVLHLPLTQSQIGEVLGLSGVHVNRVVNRLEEEGLIQREGPVYRLLDIPRLEGIAGLPRRVPQRDAPWLPAAR